MVLILTTADKKTTAVKIGKALLKKRLIACYNLFPMKSAYWWKGKIVKTQEFLLILKTLKKNFRAIEKYIKQNSSYETPEVVAIKSENVSTPYLDWIKSEIA